MKLAVLNQKGGTGKTTTSLHLADGLSRRDRSVLLVDNDPQGSIATSLGLHPRGLAEFLLQEDSLSNLIQRVSQNFFVLTGSPYLQKLEQKLYENPELCQKLHRDLSLDLNFDDLIIDMAPSRSRLNQAALYAVDEILVPVACDYLSLVGVRDILDFVDEINKDREVDIKLTSIVPTFYDARSRISSESVQTLRKHFSHKVTGPIRMSTKAKEAPSFQKTLFDYSPRSTTARDYEKLVFDLLQNL